ncbi:hypothetical protein, partial [Thiolapillus sp.]|uniref:hypothetical protein n=1 Tax=Thiolapillus sp. TaxID=2017437 RepID=UPI003AF5B5B2
ASLLRRLASKPPYRGQKASLHSKNADFYCTAFVSSFADGNIEVFSCQDDGLCLGACRDLRGMPGYESCYQNSATDQHEHNGRKQGA